MAALPARADAAAGDEAANRDYQANVQPLLKKYCFECHSENDGDLVEGEIDFDQFANVADMRRAVKVWIKVRSMIDSGQMPPNDAPKPKGPELKLMRDWVRGFLLQEARRHAGDPGPVVLRRLSNAEYNYTLQDLTGVESLDPTREFPVDGAAGEGFTNTGSAQSMSPSLVQKYLDAAKEVSNHLVLLPDGVTFSPHTTRRDQTDELAARIQAFYRQFTTEGGGQSVNLQGIRFDTNQGGVLPLRQYLAATVEERDALMRKTKSIDDVASQRGLNARYLATLWTALTTHGDSPSALLDSVRQQWQQTDPASISPLVAAIETQQKILWQFNSIGHIGKDGKERTWMEPVSPLVDRRDFRLPLPEGPASDVSVFLTASDAGDGREHDFTVWENPRLVTENGPDIALRDLAGLQKRLQVLQREALSRTTDYLAAATRAASLGPDVSAEQIATLAAKHKLDLPALRVWLEYLAISDSGPVLVSGHFEQTVSNGDYDFIKGWGTGATPIVNSNASDQEVRLPGIARPHQIQAHPSPTLFAAIGWQSPISGLVQIDARLSDAHPECGNGQEWFVQHRTGRKVGNLWQGQFNVGGSATMPPAKISVRKGELVSFLLGPRDGSHSCDLTEMNLVVTELSGEKRVWDLAKDVADDLLAGNPHADSHGNARTWHFYKGEMSTVDQQSGSLVSVPADSVLARWQQERDPGRKAELARAVQQLATGQPPADANSPDGVLHAQLMNLALSPHSLDALLTDVEADARFGRHPLGHNMPTADLVVQAPSTIEFRIPATLAAGRELVVNGRLDAKDGRDGSVRLEATLQPLAPAAIPASSPIVTSSGSEARSRVETAFNEFRELFPPNLCYARIVPVDEVVTLTLFYRQDDALRRLMLDDDQAAGLDRLWDELFYVAQEPLRFEVAFEQIREFATQDRPDLVKVWDPLKPKVIARANDFRKRLVDTEPAHLQAVLDFSDRAWRRPLTAAERDSLTGLYRNLRAADIPHDEAIRLTLARVLTSPAFLYRREVQPDGSTPLPVRDAELASRLSYFLWSSAPDSELRRLADANSLTNKDAFAQQTRRMLADPRTRRLAVQFACQWLHVRNFDQNDEKNEALYPEFASLRDDMYEETVAFFEDMFRNDGSILDLLGADHTFLNETLAKHYGIEGVSGDTWRRVDGIRSRQRGGVLAMATFLASQSGASRTSPILRGNWVYETLLGEKLPKPPPNVPQLPEEVPTGLTARQLIEQHSVAPGCVECHILIDPYGFSLEQYDVLGRVRPAPVDTKTKLVGGEEITGIDGLRNYLLTTRRDDVIRQFCRKLLGFALGREVQLSDEVLLADMLKSLEANGFRFSVAVQSIVDSRQFREIRGSQWSEE